MLPWYVYVSMLVCYHDTYVYVSMLVCYHGMCMLVCYHGVCVCYHSVCYHSVCVLPWCLMLSMVCVCWCVTMLVCMSWCVCYHGVRMVDYMTVCVYVGWF